MLHLNQLLYYKLYSDSQKISNQLYTHTFREVPNSPNEEPNDVFLEKDGGPVNMQNILLPQLETHSKSNTKTEKVYYSSRSDYTTISTR